MDFKQLFNKFMSFATIGALMTALSLGINTYCLEILKLPLLPTYVGVNAVLILFSFFLNSHFTFKSEINFRNSLKYYSIYITSLCVGACLVALFDHLLDFKNFIYPYMALPFTLSINFLLSSKFLTLKNATP